MNDPVYPQVFYKQIINPDEIPEILDCFHHLEEQINHLARGIRYKGEQETPQWIEQRLNAVLTDYLGAIKISPYIRLYRHICGDVKPHRDQSLYNHSNYTCLIYLSDDFEGGKLSLKIPQDEKETHYDILTITPRRGYGVVFHKSLIHYADEVTSGSKDIMIVDLSSP